MSQDDTTVDLVRSADPLQFSHEKGIG